MIDSDAFYKKCYDNFGSRDTRSLGWCSNKEQAFRFNKVCSIGIRDGDSVLDVGCGFSDLYFYLERRYNKISYFGIEQDEKFYEICKKNLSSGDGKVKNADFLNCSLGREYDWVVCSGLFPFDKEDYFQSMTGYLEKMINSSKNGVSFNVLTDSMPLERQHIGFKYNKVSEVIDKVVVKMTDRYRVYSDYLPGDSTFHIFKP